MKRGFYLKLAWTNIQKNHRFFLPRILSETGLLACFYIALTLTMDDRIKEARGGYLIAPLMSIGLVVLILLSTVLMLYINSFLMKQRTREFGVYNVLGMEKRHIGKVLFRENEISSLISVASGLVFGIIFYKLSSLLICRLLQSDILLGFYYIRPLTLILSGGFFLVLDLFTFAVNRIRIARMKPVELLKSMNAGEKEPNVKWLMLLIGLFALGSGYYLAVTIENPVQALSLFLVAVILVMIGTYFLFIAGSIFVLKRLKANKKFYYQKNHMAAVSGLLYRMKQNAVGLASIAILATGVLIMVSTTVSLYTGYGRSLDKNYPRDLYLYASYPDKNGNRVNVPCETLEKIIREASQTNGLEIAAVDSNHFLEVSYCGADNQLETATWTSDISMISDLRDLSQVVSITYITEDEYNALTNSNMDLAGDEIAICQISATGGGVLNLEKPIGLIGKNFQIRELLYTFPISNQILAGTVSTYGIVVSDQEVLDEIYKAQKDAYKENASRMMDRIAVIYRDQAQASVKGTELRRSITDRFLATFGEGYYYNLDTYWDAKENMLGMYGTLFFLGILLGTVFIFTTTLIIYYKQISEGYEDRSRFQIMEKIGMSRQEIKKTINTQVRLVFFLPLIVAAIHMIFAFPLLNKMLKLLSLYSMSLFVICTVITFAVFAVIYVLIYKATSRAYLRIVS